MKVIIAKCIVFDPDGKVLVLRREPNDESRPGEVDFPGGNVEEGESLNDGLAREVSEEAGLLVKSQDLRLVWTVTQDDKIRLLFLCSRYTGDVKLSFEHDAFWWMSPADTLNAFEGISWHTGVQAVLGDGFPPL